MNAWYVKTNGGLDSRYIDEFLMLLLYSYRITVVGQLATPASVNFAGALMIYAAVTIGTDGSFIPSTGQVLGL